MRKVIGIAIALAAMMLIVRVERAAAQVEAPDRKYLYNEDRTKKKVERKRREQIRQKQKNIAKQTKVKGFPFDITATSVQYDAEQKVVRGEGGVIISYGSSILEAEHGEVSVSDKVATLSGDVRVTDITGNISADSATLDFKDSTGSLMNADLYFEDGGYKVYTKEAKKLEAETYTMHESLMTTCDCPEEGCTVPWQIQAADSKITRDGYGQAWNAVFRAYEVPVMYVPYLFFPAKTKRQTGFLPPSIGVSGKTGFDLGLPFYWAIDKSSDATITPIIETRARTGVDLEYRKLFSRINTLDMGGKFFNEELRGDRTLGTVTEGLSDPTHDTNRFGGYLDSYAASEIGGQPAQLIVEGRYTSDDLFLRELDKEEDIAAYNSRYVTSRAVARVGFLNEFTFETAAEYNQAMVENDERVFQILPQASVQGMHSFRPFGENLLGARLLLQDDWTATNFSRKELYDGVRAEALERVKVPFHVYNYVSGDITPDIRLTQYSLNNRTDQVGDPTTGSLRQIELEETSDRVLPSFTGRLSTVVEKVYDMGPWNPIKALAELGQTGRQAELERVKHSIEPLLRYRYIPHVDQSDNPVFDSEDQLPKRNVVTYGITQRLYGRFDRRDEYIYGIEEATPEVTDLGVLGTRTPIDEAFSFGLPSPDDANYIRSGGMRRELANLKIVQTYDINEENDTTDLERISGDETNPFSDVGVRSLLLPNEYLHFLVGTDINPDTRDFDSYQVGIDVRDKRGDSLRSRITFTNGAITPVRQIESNAEFRVTDRVQLGYYSRYDDVNSEFIEQKAGIRFRSACKCWILDLDMSDRLNPDETRFMFNLTLIGLGEIGNTFMSRRPEGQTTY